MNDEYYEAKKRQAVDAVTMILNGDPSDPLTKKVRRMAGIDVTVISPEQAKDGEGRRSRSPARCRQDVKR